MTSHHRKKTRLIHGNWIGEQCTMLMPISSPAESQTLLSHWLTIDTSSISVSCAVQLVIPQPHKTNNHILSQTAKDFHPWPKTNG